MFRTQDVSPHDIFDRDVSLPDVSDQDVSPLNILDKLFYYIKYMFQLNVLSFRRMYVNF